MFKKILVLLLFLGPKFVLAQHYDNEFNEVSAWSVVQIDEFVERFDKDDSTRLMRFYHEHNPGKPQLTRDTLIKSLFNQKRKDWNFNELKEFIAQVENKNNPVILDFYKGDWYATVTCNVLWKEKPQTVILKMKIQNLANGGSKWVIFDAQAKFLKARDNKGIIPAIVQPVLPAPESKTSLNPMSHATDFLNIDNVSDNSKNIRNYIAQSDKYSDDLCLFINECVNNRLKIINAKSITYTCLQVKGWNIEIKEFDRRDSESLRVRKNAGWLISKLTKVSS